MKVDGLGETLLFTRTKSDKNWPRYGASNTTRSKQDFCPALADLIKAQYRLRHRTINQSNSSNRNVSKCVDQSDHKDFLLTQPRSDSKLITVTPMRARKISCHFYKGAREIKKACVYLFLQHIFIGMPACACGMFTLILGRATSLVMSC